MNGGTPTYRSLVLVLVKPLLRKCAVGDKWHKWGDGGNPTGSPPWKLSFTASSDRFNFCPSCYE